MKALLAKLLSMFHEKEPQKPVEPWPFPPAVTKKPAAKKTAVKKKPAVKKPAVKKAKKPAVKKAKE